MKKICVKCGKERFMMSWESECYQCNKERLRDETTKAIQDAEEDETIDTGSSDYVFCPYCGEAMETDYGYEDFPEIYEEGEHTITCPECNKDFILETSCSWYYETKKREESND